MVLLADDEVMIRDLVQEALEEAGFAVIPAAIGAEVVERLQDGDTFCALVTDTNFGGPPGGWEVATAAELSPTIAIVYMTGDSAHEWSARGVPNSFVIAKPFAPSQIVVALASLLNRADGAA